MKIQEQILNEFEWLGYEDVSINLWKGVRLYVNIKGEKPFCLRLDKGFSARKTYSMIASGEKLPEPLFQNMKHIAALVWKERERIAQEMEDGVYYKTEKIRKVEGTCGQGTC